MAAIFSSECVRVFICLSVCQNTETSLPPSAPTALSAGPTHQWSPSCKGNKRRIKCLSSDEVLVTAQVSVSVSAHLLPVAAAGWCG